MSQISVVLNGEEAPVPAGSSLLDLVESLGRDPRTVAVELNGAIVGRDAYGEQRLEAGDRLEVVHFVQGGLSFSGGAVIFLSSVGR